jgi:midasin (ATPase involved in ribosome maturation)
VQTADLDQMSKFAYLTQRVFLYLIAQGFCGEEDDEESDVEPPSDLERDGMGMGEGKGEDNVADQIENEE